MNNNQTPGDFDTVAELENFKNEYRNLREIGQGGPTVGDLSIDGRLLDGDGFGGPLICQSGFLYIPIYVKGSSYGWGFKLGIIDLRTLDLTIFGEIKPVLHLDKIDDNRLYYFTSWDKHNRFFYEGIIR